MSMQWEKPTESLTAAFDAAVPEHPAVTKRKMFGNPAAFVAGNMFTCVFQTGVFVRLEGTEVEELVRSGTAAPFEPMPGRAMKGYVEVPSKDVADPAALQGWMQRSLAFSLSLPAKEPKPKKPKAAAKKKAG